MRADDVVIVEEGDPFTGRSCERAIACGRCTDAAGAEHDDAVVVDGNCAAPTPFYRDADGDGQGSAAAAVLACEAPAGFVDNDLDCADLDPDE